MEQSSSNKTASSSNSAAAHYIPDRYESPQELESNFWKEQYSLAEQDELDFKKTSLPLARIKKVMKTDPSVKMIAAEVPIIFSKASEAFIEELALRAWIEADKHDRKTLGRADVAAALKQTDIFLIDIVPREEGQHEKEKEKKSRPTKRRKTEQDN